MRRTIMICFFEYDDNVSVAEALANLLFLVFVCLTFSLNSHGCMSMNTSVVVVAWFMIFVDMCPFTSAISIVFLQVIFKL